MKAFSLFAIACLVLAVALMAGCVQQEKLPTTSQNASGTGASGLETSGSAKQPPPPETKPEPPPLPPKSLPRIDYSKNYPVSDANIPGFEKKKTGSAFIAYYHTGDETNANKSLAVLEQAGLDLYKKYFGLSSSNIQVFLAASAEDYVRIADFPGGIENTSIGAGSAPGGKIFLYKPFEDTVPERVEGMIVHEGAHAAIFQVLGKENAQYFPGFLNEGMAHYIEYVFQAGPNFDPLHQIYHSDLLISGTKTGNPKLLSLEELGQKCEGYISEETLNFLCRGQGAFTIWHIKKTYGENALQKFLSDLKQTQDWKQALTSATGKNPSKLGQEIQEHLNSLISQQNK